MKKEQQNKLVKELNNYYGNEFERTNEGKKIYVTFEFEQYQELSEVIHGINSAIETIGIALSDGCFTPEPHQTGSAIEKLTQLNKRFLSHSIFDGLDVATDMIE